MDLELVGSYPPIDPVRLASIEASLGLQFPADYRSFILRHNGGSCVDTVTLRVPHGGSFGWFLAAEQVRVFSPQDECASCGIEWLPEDTQGLLCIGYDDGYGRMIVLGCPGCIGAKAGAVYLWSDLQLIELAASFAEFREQMRPEPWDELHETLPEFVAVELNEAATLSKLLADGLNVNARNSQGETLLMCAARHGRIRILQSLLSRGADVDAIDDRGWTALVHAANGRGEDPGVDAFQLLLAAGANVNVRVEQGNSLLMHLLKCTEWSRVISIVLDCRPNISIVNDLGENALSCCAWLFSKACDAQVLQLLGMKPDVEHAIAVWRRVMFDSGRDVIHQISGFPPEATSVLENIDKFRHMRYMEKVCEILTWMERADILREFARGPNGHIAILALPDADSNSSESAALLRELLQTGNENAREDAAIVLVYFPRDAMNVQALQAALADPDERVRQAAQNSLEILADEDS